MNFLGPYDEFVTSGSDDGNFFIWDKLSGQLVDILEGDGSIVNVIEGHPTLPLVAVSGIDTTVKVGKWTFGVGCRSTDMFLVVCTISGHRSILEDRAGSSYRSAQCPLFTAGYGLYCGTTACPPFHALS